MPFPKKRELSEELLFFELSQSIVGQQISAKAADAIWNRLISFSSKKQSFKIYVRVRFEMGEITGLVTKKA